MKAGREHGEKASCIHSEIGCIFSAHHRTRIRRQSQIHSCAGARHMAGKARPLRQAALKAHAAAAAKIEHMQNDARELGPLTLDLHGLHASEAVEAVARR